MLLFVVATRTALIRFGWRTTQRVRWLRQRLRVAEGCRERGQATAEYALVLLAAAAIALVLVAWATKTGKLTRLFDAVIDQIIGKAK